MRDIWRVVRAPDPDVDEVVRRQLLIQAGEASRLSNLLGVGLLVITATVLVRGGAPAAGTIAWSLLCLAWLIFFHLATRDLVTHPARDPAGVPTGTLTRRFMVIQACGGMVWGGACALIRPEDDHPALIAVPAVVLILADAANLLFCAATPTVFRVFHTSVVLTGSLGLASQGAWSLVALVAFGALGAPQLARYGYQQVAGARVLARQNLLLAEELRQEREGVEQVNLQLSEMNAELAHRATRDPLTGLPNRSLFSDHLASTLARGRATGRRPGVIFFDLDRFKLVNDSLGHGAGDDLLRQVGERVTAVLRSGDVLARLGGDEFVVLTADPLDLSGAVTVAERIRRVLGEPFTLEGRTVRISSSLGVALDDGTLDGDQLVEQADVALYRAKELGRNQVATFNPTLLRGTERSGPDRSPDPTGQEQLNRLLAGHRPGRSG